MQIVADQIDDLKTDRKDIMPALPMVFRVVPILFYGALVFLIVIGSLAFWNMRVATQKRDAIKQRITSLQTEIATTKADRAALEVKIREATDLEAWVLASMPLQPLIVAIVRSMDPQSSIVDLKLERDTETPSQLRLGLRLNTNSDQQLEDTLEVIRRMNYREFSPTQTRVRGDLDYRASLLWQNPHRKMPSPSERAQEIVQP
jgi:cell division protein FtsB